MRINIQARDSKNVETIKIIHGMHTPLNKVYTKTRRIIRTTTTTTIKNNTKSQNRLDWKNHHTIAFEEIKRQIIIITQNKHFDINKETRVKCDISRKGLGAALEQKHNSIWKPDAYASRFLNKLEERYSTNELELLAIVWALEHFKYYLYGNKFTLQTDHQALLSALKNNRGNRT